MSRATSLSPNWALFAERCGGIYKLAEELGISYATLFRIARGLVPIDDAMRAKIITVAAAKGCASPVKAPSKATRTVKLDDDDYEILEYLGESIASRKRIPEELTRHLATRLTTPVLIKLADSDDTSPNVQRAVAKLLGL